MAEMDLNVSCDFTTETGDGDGDITMKMDTLHITLPPAPVGMAYRIKKAGSIATVSAEYIKEGDQ